MNAKPAALFYLNFSPRYRTEMGKISLKFRQRLVLNSAQLYFRPLSRS
jgi:hypothetical protein